MTAPKRGPGRPPTGRGIPLNTRVQPPLHARVKAAGEQGYPVPRLLEIALDAIGK